MYRLPLALSEGQFEEAVKSPCPARGFDHEVRCSVAVVLVEMAAADGHFDFGEARIIVRLLKRYFNISQAKAFDLLNLANSKRKIGWSLESATRLLALRMDKKELVDVFAMADRVMVHDRIIKAEERRLREKLGKLLRLSDDEQLRTLSEARLAQEVGDLVHKLRQPLSN